MGFQNVVVGRINGVVALTGFSYEEMYGRFAGTKKSRRNNEVVVRRGSTVTLIRYRFRFNVTIFFMALNDKIRSEKLCV